MRIFANCSEAIAEIERDIYVRGRLVHPERMQDKDVKHDDSFITKELTCYTFTILDGRDRDAMLKKFDIPKEYVQREWNDRLSGIMSELANPGIAWKITPKLWKQYLDREGKFDYTYSERFYEYKQPEFVREELRKHPNSRQGIVSIYNPNHDARNIGQKRIPCSMYYQFMIREDKLNLIYTMRSCDFLNHFGADVWLAFEFQRWMAGQLLRKPGNLTMFIGSLHVYKKYMRKMGVF